jgi:hypothetical protein
MDLTEHERSGMVLGICLVLGGVMLLIAWCIG